MTFDELYGNLREGVVRAVVDAGPQPDEMVRLQMALDAAEDEIERLRQALCDIQFDLINCPEAAGTRSCEHLKDAIGIVTRTLAPPEGRQK